MEIPRVDASVQFSRYQRRRIHIGHLCVLHCEPKVHWSTHLGPPLCRVNVSYLPWTSFVGSVLTKIAIPPSPKFIPLMFTWGRWQEVVQYACVENTLPVLNKNNTEPFMSSHSVLWSHILTSVDSFEESMRIRSCDLLWILPGLGFNFELSVFQVGVDLVTTTSGGWGDDVRSLEFDFSILNFTCVTIDQTDVQTPVRNNEEKYRAVTFNGGDELRQRYWFLDSMTDILVTRMPVTRISLQTDNLAFHNSFDFSPLHQLEEVFTVAVFSKTNQNGWIWWCCFMFGLYEHTLTVLSDNENSINVFVCVHLYT